MNKKLWVFYTVLVANLSASESFHQFMEIPVLRKMIETGSMHSAELRKTIYSGVLPESLRTLIESKEKEGILYNRKYGFWYKAPCNPLDPDEYMNPFKAYGCALRGIFVDRGDEFFQFEGNEQNYFAELNKRDQDPEYNCKKLAHEIASLKECISKYKQLGDSAKDAHLKESYKNWIQRDSKFLEVSKQKFRIGCSENMDLVKEFAATFVATTFKK